jgi:predicted murein hydrolase (TIGR00659 family)
MILMEKFTTPLAMLLLTLIIYQFFAWLQKRSGYNWLNPMLLSILVLVPLLLQANFSFEQYLSGAKVFNYLLEPAVVALGYPLYEQIKHIRQQWQILVSLTLLGVVIAITTSFILAVAVGASHALAVSMALKSITTPIAIELTTELNGIVSITALAIIAAGLAGGLFGVQWLTWLGIRCPKAQGLAIGCASHAFGTASVSKISFEHGAYASLALILSATFTAMLSPLIIPLLSQLLS